MNRLNLFPKPAFIERMKHLLTDEKDFQNYLEILKHEPVRSIRCNTLKISPNELKKRLEEKNWKISQPWKNYPEVMIVEGKIKKIQDADKNNIADNQKNKINNKKTSKNFRINNFLTENRDEVRFEVNQSANKVSSNLGWAGGNNLIPLEPGELGRSLEHLLGYYYIQELASMLPTIALDPHENELILDLAASPGSKTTQISAKINNTGTIIANEISLGRIKILASNLERCGCTNVIITRKDGVAFCERIKKFNPEMKFDKILVDAPCSGEGTLRSTPKTYQMWNPKTIQSLSRLQKHLVSNAIEILKKGGTLVYSTCTHAPEENEDVVNFILENFPEMKIETINLPIKCREGITEWNTENEESRFDNSVLHSEGRENSASVRGIVADNFKPAEKKSKKFSSEVNKSCRIYPHDADTEGFFIAKLTKK